uniref:Nuclear protein MDM1 n=1 Tax=Sus scrofa TaxID=9823 RepID=A0A8D1ZAT3_PIG
MPVRFKGLSEYQRNFLWKKSYLSESYNPSVGRRYPWAGLRSDQLGKSKAPFLSSHMLPTCLPKIFNDFEWVSSVQQSESVIHPERSGPRNSKKTKKKKKKKKKKARDLKLKISKQRKRRRKKTCRADTELPCKANGENIQLNYIPFSVSIQLSMDTFLILAVLTCGVFHNKSKFVPQFKGNSVIHETEYKRNFKGLSPVKEPKLRNDLKENRNFEIISPEKKCNKTDDPLKLEAEMESKDSNQPKKKVTPWKHQRLGKVNSEYRAKFLSPSQYLYKAGAWTRVKENIPNQGSLNAMWYAEVKELREKAEFYRKRVQGTHFSRDHLNQILSDNNRCWDVSSTTSSEGTISSNIRALDLAGDPTSLKASQKCPTKLEERTSVLEEQPEKTTTEKLDVSNAPIPVRRRLAWDAENTTEDQKHLREEEEEEEKEERDKQVNVGELEKLEVQEESKADKMQEGSESSSVSSGKGGRLPTPKLRELGGIQRTHHDLTTPAVGGAVLVSPSKVKPPVPEQKKRTSSQDGLEALKNDFRKKESRAISLLTSPAAGLKTVDPLPLREDSEPNISRSAEATLPVSKIPDYPTNTPKQSPSPPPHPTGIQLVEFRAP